jgi:hypothetical protein
LRCPCILLPLGFKPWTHDEQLADGIAYAKLAHPTTKASTKAQDEFVKAHSSQWTKLSRLPYFNVCQMIIIDLMHAVLLGV